MLILAACVYVFAAKGVLYLLSTIKAGQDFYVAAAAAAAAAACCGCCVLIPTAAGVSNGLGPYHV
jgi:hypothetical protein